MGRMVRRNQTRMSRIRWSGVVSVMVSLCVLPVTPQDDTPAPEAINEDAHAIDQTDAAAEDEAADLTALESELASAKRFEAELEALLLPNGQLDTAQDDAQIKLTSLATRCGILSNSAMHEEVRLVLLGYQARALSAMASVRPAQDPGQAEQLNDVAQQIAAIELPGAASAADYWLLIAEMTQQASAKQSPTKRQARTVKALATFIRKHAQDPAAAEYLLDTRLALAELMDQRGDQPAVAKLLTDIGELPDDSPRLADTNRLAKSVQRIGTPIAFESISTQLTNWRSTDHIGKPVLIHVYADSVESSTRMIDVISRRIVGGTLSGIAVVSLRVGDAIAGSNAPPWPTLPMQLEPNGVLDQLGVVALPTLAWLDDQGNLASIGTTAAVLDRLDAIQSPPPIQAPESDASDPSAEPASKATDEAAEAPEDADTPGDPGEETPSF